MVSPHLQKQNKILSTLLNKALNSILTNRHDWHRPANYVLLISFPDLNLQNTKLSFGCLAFLTLLYLRQPALVSNLTIVTNTQEDARTHALHCKSQIVSIG